MNSIDEMVSNITGYLRPNLFTIDIVPPTAISGLYNRKISLNGNATTFPFATFSEGKFYYNNLDHKFATEKDYDPVSMTFYVDNDSDVLDFFIAWQSLIIGNHHLVSYKRNYVGTGIITLVDESKRFKKSAKLINMYPTNINGLDLAYSSNNSILELSMSMNFDDVEYV
ncbi:hypothetical protein [uncultured Arcobacter sp.]|uniref:hypothetical protein n=1 Tax=uncultured Arcobacter sp. TaxID=165434 RepID=UPI00261A6774|nr:hypothetical protein [uncultured Arcobacter sp.]